MGLSHQCHSGAQPASSHRALESGLVDLQQLAGCWVLGARLGALSSTSSTFARSLVRSFARSLVRSSDLVHSAHSRDE